MADDLQRLERFGAGLLERLSPGQRAVLARRIARDLRTAQAKRIRANRNPDGSPYAPRRPQGGRHAKRGPMFRRLGAVASLQAIGSPDQALVRFTARVQRIARVHHEGLPDRVRPGGPIADYPARRLLGFGAADIDLVRARITEHLTRGLVP